MCVWPQFWPRAVPVGELAEAGGRPHSPPDTANVPVGGRATFTLSPAQAADWTVNDLVGGTATVGRITAIGVYTAPFVIPSPTTVTMVTIGASAATNTATVTIVSRFADGGAVSVGTCSNPCTPSSVAVSDLDGDGRADYFVTANTDSGDVSVLRRNQTTFFAPDLYPINNRNARPEAVVVADFNNDTIPDLATTDAVSTPSTRAIRVRLGVSGGTFDTLSEMVTSLPQSNSGPSSMAVGQFNSGVDTLRDLVVANLNGDEVSILLSNGNGTFLVARTFSAANGIASPFGVAVADFNRDSLDDVAVANSRFGEVLVFLQLAAGQFGPPQTSNAGGGPTALAAVDLNLDGYPDLVVTDGTGNRLVTFINTQSGSQVFGSTASQVFSTGDAPTALAVSDVNGDGFPDVVVVNNVPTASAGSVTVFLGYGDGTAVASETYPVGSAPLSVAVGDFNGDGWPDLAVANSGDDTVTILRNRGS